MNYLYNGVELPALPDYDREKYPYALIGSASIDGNGDTFYEFAASSIPIVHAKGAIEFHNYTRGSGGVWGVIHPEKQSTWTVQQEWDEDGGPVTLPDVPAIWANYDVPYSDGSGYSVLASEPVPVTETDHNARIMGWIAGKRLAAMRGKA